MRYLCTLALMVLCGCSNPAQQDKQKVVVRFKTDLELLQGKWACYIPDTQSFDRDKIKVIWEVGEQTIKGISEMPPGISEMKFLINPGTNPKRIDFISDSPDVKNMTGIYSLSDDAWMVHFHIGENRPVSFSDPCPLMKSLGKDHLFPLKFTRIPP